MFQYTSGYQPQTLNYAFLPQMPYQICYLPSEQMCFMPTPLLQNNYDFLTFNHVPSPHGNLPSPQLQLLQSIPSPSTEGQPQTPLNKSHHDFILQKNDVELRSEPKQKFGRNICSNIFHLMVKFIKKQKKMKAVVSRIIQQNNMSIKLNEFYQIFKNRSYKLKAYANIAKISQFWRGPIFAQSEMNSKNQKEVECSKIFRIVSKLYLNYHHLPYVYNSLKIKSESKKLHMDSIRKILSL